MIKYFFIIIVQIIKIITIDGHFFSLNSNDWTVYNDNKRIFIRAHVPGGIYSDLFRERIIQDPLYDRNHLNYRWIGKQNWTYTRHFKDNISNCNMFVVPSEFLKYSSTHLIVDGIDSVSYIYLNQRYIGFTSNMFTRYSFKIVLSSIINTISVKILSPVYALHPTNYTIPPNCPPSIINGLCHINLLRKMQCSFGWDWAPAIPSSGIWKNIGIEGSNASIVKEVMVSTTPLHNTWLLNITAIIKLYHPSENILVIKFNGNVIRNEKFRIETTLNENYYYNYVHVLNESVKLWWPNGMGLFTKQGLKLPKRNLYDLEIILNNNEESRIIKRIGFRTIELIQERVLSGSTFYFKVNKVPLFIKGSNWVPSSMFPEKQKDLAYIRGLLNSAVAANMNMLRIWGGGVYESDEFYSLADEYGLLIWHDFMFAVALYPADDIFLSSVSTEVTQQIQRLQSHPCIAIWAGNNENEVAISDTWWIEITKNFKQFKSDYVKLYIDTIRSTVLYLDPNRPFLASSPTNGPISEKEGWIAKNPYDVRYGDVHYYNYLKDPWDWNRFPSAKFVSEFGFQSYPSLRTLMTAFSINELNYPFSKSLSIRQHHFEGDMQIKMLIGEKMLLPAAGSWIQLHKYIILSQISQAMALKLQIEFYRRNRILHPNGSGFTMGAMYWQLNDVWQAPSWSSIEFGGNWKMSHYYIKNAFSPILVVPYLLNKANSSLLIVDVINDALNDVELTVTLLAYHHNSFVPFVLTHARITALKQSVITIMTADLENILKESSCTKSSCIIRAEYENLGISLCRDNFLFLDAPLNSVGYTQPKIVITAIVQDKTIGDWKTFRIDLESRAIAFFVWIDWNESSNIQGIFSDNGFIMMDSIKSVVFSTRQTFLNKTLLMKDIRITTLLDTN